MTDRGRRRFLVAGAAVATGAGLGVWALLRARDVGADLLREAGLGRMFENPDAVRAVGEWYRERYPRDSDRQRLAEEVFGERAARFGEPQELRQALVEGVRDDYRAGHTLDVDGWIISVRELRLCALLSQL